MKSIARAALTVIGILALGYLGKVVLFGTKLGTLGNTPIACDTNGPCRIGAWVEQDGMIGCIVKSNYNEIRIGRGFKPKLVWEITQDSSDASDYWFANNGIRLNPADGNEEDKDLHDGQHDHPKQKKYKWDNHNSRPKNIHFDVLVRRVFVGSGHQENTSIPCDARDPLIANSGN